MALASKAEVSIRVHVLNDHNEPISTALKFVGREAWTLRKLIDAGERGISSLDYVGPRTSHYIWKLRKNGIAIGTLEERHAGDFPGVHARYTLDGIKRMSFDEDFGERAFGNHFRKVASQQINKDAVVAEALADLRAQPPSDEEANAGPGQVSEEFMSRFEGYAEGATTEQLRERWGRVLASEIRRPGTFSRKVLRATDELDATAAALFESLMRYRVRNVLVKSIMPDLQFSELLALTSAGLITEPGLGGHRITFGAGRNEAGAEIWVSEFGNTLVGVAKSVEIPTKYSEVVFRPRNEDKPGYGVYILTDVGVALSSILPSRESILPSRESEVGIAFAQKLRSHLPADQVFLWVAVQPKRYTQVPIPE